MKAHCCGCSSPVEIVRWHGVKREERVCKECHSGEVEDACH